MNQDHRWEATARESATSAAAVQAEDAARARRRWITLGVVAGSLLIFAVAAIAWSPGSPQLEANRDNAAALDTHKQIFQEVVRRINNLDSTIALDMSTEDVIVLNTEGGEAPLAVLTDDPDRPGDQFTRLRVVNGSPLFVTRGVRGREGNHPGDAVYYYAQVDTSDKEYQVYRGLTQPKAFALEVDRVIDEDTLLVHGGLSGPVEQPFRLEVRRRVYTTNIHTDVKKWMKQNPAETDWEPSPDRQTLVQMVEHLNQWIGELSDGWDAAYQREPLLDSLAPVGDPIASYFLPPVLQRQQFDYHDARMLEETTWLRDIKNLVGDQPTDLEKARKLFDWTIRNVQLEDPASRFGRLPRRPWQTLMYGGGTALERA